MRVVVTDAGPKLERTGGAAPLLTHEPLNICCVQTRAADEVLLVELDDGPKLERTGAAAAARADEVLLVELDDGPKLERTSGAAPLLTHEPLNSCEVHTRPGPRTGAGPKAE